MGGGNQNLWELWNAPKTPVWIIPQVYRLFVTGDGIMIGYEEERPRKDQFYYKRRLARSDAQTYDWSRDTTTYALEHLLQC